MTMTARLLNLAFIILLLVSSIYDVKYKKIPNCFVITLTIAVVFTKNISLTGVMAATAIITVMLLQYKSGKIGGGDIKLVLPMGMYLGGMKLIISVSAALFSAIVYMMILKKRSVPLAPFYCIGTIISLIGGTYFGL
mgnify:CR=1 FL=1